ncbi:hypothetical protein Poli38472_012551 [Pythium oligandrum]|uniref:FYVE-type domain-containing protein n=1 Tax=Pythium oligandrum TaxID=41045 RepID=A0A8K1CDV0_PYTOL|nr:hypothetical protein Poli38472_012551 [Pythium oligandrum]|eukprot:TMW61360.1 hypothetical protein Poli38472_012551 [Pythium oligandrum]
MPRTPVSETIPNLEFSPSERHDVIEIVAGVIAETLRVERQYLAQYGELNKHDWKEVRGGRGGMRIFKERRRSESHGRPSFSGSVDLEEIDLPSVRSVAESIYSDSVGSFSSDSIPMRLVDQIHNDTESSNEASSHSSGGSISTPESIHTRVPMVAGVGHVEGNLEDVAFGLYAGDEVSWKERGAYIKDGYNYSRILSTILGPTSEDPYRFLGVKWFAREEKNLVYGTMIQDRDFLVIEATGIAQDELGEPHGYYVIHSFRHPLVPEYTDRKMLRCEISLCIISRQVSPNMVRLFTRGFIDPKGSLTPSMAISVSTKRLSVCMKTVETAHSRKLVWLMKQSRTGQGRQHTEVASSRACEVCNKSFRFLSANLSFCQVCSKCICTKCTVQRKVVVDATADCATKHLLPFCSACVLEAKHLAPHSIALDTILRRVAS